MEQLNNFKLVFDAECPICVAYSNAFVKTGMLDNAGRESYQQMTTLSCTLIDKERARNEIALVNIKTGEVYYGIDSIFKVIANSFPFLKSLFDFAPFYWTMKKIYLFIAYNRKIIVPGKAHDDSCVPDFNIKYRLAYIVFTWIVTSFILAHYSRLLTGQLPSGNFFRAFNILGGQIVFQTLVIWFLAKDKVFQYLGNMMTISFAASLLLLLFVFVGNLLSITNPIIYAGFGVFTLVLMFLEHIRRMKLIGVSWLASLTCVVYLSIVLIIIS